MKRAIITASMCLPTLLTAAAGVSADSWTCHKADLTRHVLVYYPQAPAALPCRVFYTKPKENVVPRPLWQADNTDAYCERKAAEFIAKLVSWGWRCTLDAPDSPTAGKP